MARYFSAASFFLALAATVVWITYRSGELLKMNGLMAVIPLATPVVVALAPLVFQRRGVRILATIILILSLFSYIGGFSIGMAYIPSSLMMLLAACMPDQPSTPHWRPMDWKHPFLMR